MRKKSINSVLLAGIVIICITLTFSTTAFAYDEKKPMVLKVGISSPATEDEAKAATMFGKIVQKRTKGRVQFKFFYGASLIKKPQLVEGVARGIADISIGPISFVTGKIPAASIFEVYGSYQLDRFSEMVKAINPILVELFEKYGIHHLGAFNPGPGLFVHKKKFLKSPKDWQGQKNAPGRKMAVRPGKKMGRKSCVYAAARAVSRPPAGRHRRVYASLAPHLCLQAL